MDKGLYTLEDSFIHSCYIVGAHKEEYGQLDKGLYTLEDSFIHAFIVGAHKEDYAQGPLHPGALTHAFIYLL